MSVDKNSRRLLVVGAGMTSAAHFVALRAVGADIIGIVTTDPDRADTARRYVPSAQIVSSVEQGIALGADTGIVLTPPSSHLHVTEVLAGAGLDVVIEKPLAADSLVAQKMVEVI